jgi:hypothetical protein
MTQSIASPDLPIDPIDAIRRADIHRLNAPKRRILVDGKVFQYGSWCSSWKMFGWLRGSDIRAILSGMLLNMGLK